MTRQILTKGYDDDEEDDNGWKETIIQGE